MQKLSLPSLALLPPEKLTARLYSLRAQERSLLVEFLAYLGELDNRKLYLELGFPSTFAFCTDHLGLTKSSAFRRVTAARLLVRFPALADGRLCLTTVVELRDVLSAENLALVLDRAAGRTEDEVKVLAAALKPRPAPPDLLRRVPERQPAEVSLPIAPSIPALEPAPATIVQSGSGPEPTPRRPEPKPARIEPISEELRVLRMTVGRDFVDDLEKVRDALSHAIPDRRLETVLHECIRRTLEACARRRSGGNRRAAVARDAGAKRSRYIPAAVRAEVWRRDEGRCAFIGSGGHRCGATYQLEIHHLVPFARGGRPTVDNLSVRCRVHNGYEAEKEFGAEHVARAMACAQKPADVARTSNPAG